MGRALEVQGSADAGWYSAVCNAVGKWNMCMGASRYAAITGCCTMHATLALDSVGGCAVDKRLQFSSYVCRCWVWFCSGLGPRQELGAVTYQYNVLGTRGPRKMTGVIPALDNHNRKLFRPSSEADNITERWGHGSSGVVGWLPAGVHVREHAVHAWDCRPLLPACSSSLGLYICVQEVPD